MSTVVLMTGSGPGFGIAKDRKGTVADPRKVGDQGRIDPVPRRHQHRRESAGEQRLCPRKRQRQFIQDCPGRPMQAEFLFFLTRKGVVFVRPAMNDDRYQPLIGDAPGKRRPRMRRNYGESHGHIEASRQAEQAVQRGAGQNGIVVAQPEDGPAARTTPSAQARP